VPGDSQSSGERVVQRTSNEVQNQGMVGDTGGQEKLDSCSLHSTEMAHISIPSVSALTWCSNAPKTRGSMHQSPSVRAPVKAEVLCHEQCCPFRAAFFKTSLLMYLQQHNSSAEVH